MRLTTSLMKLEKQTLNAIGNSMKVSQLMRFSMNVMLIKDAMEVETEAKIDEPFEEIDVKPVDDTSAEVEKEINVEVIGLK